MSAGAYGTYGAYGGAGGFGPGAGMGMGAEPGAGGGGGVAPVVDGRIRVALAAWCATMAAAAALMPLVDGAEWVAQAGLLLAAQTATGALIRWRGVHVVLTVAAQALVSLVLLTVVTAPDYATAGLLPGPAAFERFGDLLSTGADDVSRYVAPAPVTDGIRLMLLGGVLLVGLLVDLLAVTLRSAAASGLPLLALYSVAAGVSQDQSSWPYFLSAAAGYLVLLLAEGRERLGRWGRFFAGPALAPPAMAPPAYAYAPGAPPPPAPPRPPAPAAPRLRTGRRIGALTLGVAALVPLAMPSLGDGLLGLDKEGGGAGGGPGDIVSVNPVVDLQDQLNQPADRTVLSYQSDSPADSDMYLRLVALDEFDGEEWRSSRWHESDPPNPPWPVPGLSSEVAATEVTTAIIASEAYAQTSLPVPYPAIDIEAPGDYRYDRGSQTLVSEDGESVTEGLSYEVRHLLVRPTADQLAAAPDPDPELREYYTRVPDDLAPEVRSTALAVTQSAANDYERALALQEWFTQSGGFRYDTSVASGSGSDAIVRFLEQREGFCVHFAFTMAAMARTLDIPAQVAVGFTPGDAGLDGVHDVGIHNAHAWPELYFEGAGWVRFEPTPGQGTPPAYTLPEDDETEPAQPAPEETGSPDASPSPTPAPTQTPTGPEECDAGRQPGACDGPEQQTPESDGDDSFALPVWPVAFGGGGLLLAGLLASPLLWRRRVRVRRLSPGPVAPPGLPAPAGAPADSRALRAWRELNDTAWDYGVAPLATETPRQAASRIVRVAELDAEASAAVHRVAEAVEQELYAPQALRRGGGDRIVADVRLASAGLHATAGRAARLRALLLPRSGMRVMHTLTERRVRLTQRLTVALARLLRRRGRQSA
ncbi:transglutaminase family protein [Streptomyces sp. 6N223]|uniref:transglutaminase family protein n=1 Tax=Streptomyces sp. 6N223 TaxID=3457412 RepID=UPI003FD4EA28